MKSKLKKVAKLFRKHVGVLVAVLNSLEVKNVEDLNDIWVGISDDWDIHLCIDVDTGWYTASLHSVNEAGQTVSDPVLELSGKKYQRAW